MAAKNDELVENVIKGGVIVAMLVLAYLLFKKIFTTTGSGSGSGAGTGSGNGLSLAGTIHNVMQKAEKTADTVINRISNNLQHHSPDHFDTETSKAVQLGLGLAGLGNVIPFKGATNDLVQKLMKADDQARNYLNKPGSTPQINTILKTVDTLSDQDFIAVVTSWKLTAGYSNLLDSYLAGAKLTTHARSEFLNRIHKLNLA